MLSRQYSLRHHSSWTRYCVTGKLVPGNLRWCIGLILKGQNMKQLRQLHHLKILAYPVILSCPRRMETLTETQINNYNTHFNLFDSWVRSHPQTTKWLLRHWRTDSKPNNWVQNTFVRTLPSWCRYTARSRLCKKPEIRSWRIYSWTLL
jgi:hypothetical protein